ncbi:retrovirus-related pol polyprotein from transposon TNT 1-94 [Tanacetum coccineum]
MEEVNSLVDKIKNIDGTYVESLDGVVREKTAVNEHVNLNGKSYESLQSRPGEGSNTFASLLKNPNVPATTKVVRLQATKNSETVQGANVVIPMAVVEKMSNRFENTLYGYFIGHRLAFPLVENYVKNAWVKYGLERTMLKNDHFLQFSKSECMEKGLEKGPWIIRNRALIEVSSNTLMKDNVVVAIPFLNGTRHSFETVDIEYEWVPPRCDVCKVFDHDDVDCPKRVKETVDTHEEDDGYTKVTRRNGKKKQNMTKQVAGVKFMKPKPNIVYKVVSKQHTGEALKPGQEKLPNQNVPSKPASKSQPVTNVISSKTNDTSSLLTSNSFESLMNNDTENVFISSSTIVMDGDDDDEEKWKWTSNEMACSKGSRIILGWNPDIVNVVIILFIDQVMHACIVFKAEKKELFCSFIYAHNRYIQRPDESSAGSSYINTGMRDFQKCVEDIEVADVNSTGLKFTWNQKPKGNDGILKKIDRIMANAHGI